MEYNSSKLLPSSPTPRSAIPAQFDEGGLYFIFRKYIHSGAHQLCRSRGGASPPSLNQHAFSFFPLCSGEWQRFCNGTHIATLYILNIDKEVRKPCARRRHETSRDLLLFLVRCPRSKPKSKQTPKKRSFFSLKVQHRSCF